MKRGRPAKSVIRQNLVEILCFMGTGYAYEIYKAYSEIFSNATMRSIYYHLHKGVQTEEFIVKAIKKEQGNYSWGPEAEKTYYALGPAATAHMLQTVKQYFDNHRK